MEGGRRWVGEGREEGWRSTREDTECEMREVGGRGGGRVGGMRVRVEVRAAARMDRGRSVIQDRGKT